jgi:hypothetical protein
MNAIIQDYYHTSFYIPFIDISHDVAFMDLMSALNNINKLIE